VLRAYQREAVAAILAARERGETCGLVSLPTGAGKTTIAVQLLRHLHGRALIVAHTQLLVRQLRDAAIRYLNERVGLVVDGAVELGSARIVVGSRQSLSPQRLAAIADVEPFEIVIIDEAHHAAHESTYAALLDALRSHRTDLFVLGLTATPWRESGRLLFSRWWFSREIGDLIPLGVLAPVRHASVELPLEMRDVRLSGRGEREYSAQTLEPRLLDVAEQTAASIAPLLTDRHCVVVFAVTVKHAKALAEAFDRVGVSAAPIWGAMESADRDATLRRWRAGELSTLVNVGIVSEGFDEPRIDAIVFARPTASTLFYIQALGRGLRCAPGKRDCLVVDCIGLGDLRDARQCVLDAIVPEVAALNRDGGVNTRDRIERRLVAKPGDDGVHLWHPIAHDAYVLPIAQMELLFVRRNPTTGLYDAAYIENNRIRERFEPAPFAAMRSTLLVYLHGRTLVFGKRNAGWRRAPATEAQVRALARIDSTLARRATLEEWTRGRIASTLTILYGRRLADRLRLLGGDAA
jgi:superfamily II DNA or RNA helicase